MLPYNDRIDSALADKEFALEVRSLVDEACLCISLRIALRMVHVSFAVHYLIPLPVDNRTACNTDLEYIRIVGDQRDGHESAVAPSMDADAVAVDIWKVHEHLHALHLVGHLRLSALSVDRLFEFETTVLCSSVVLYIHEISSLCHVHFPTAKQSHVCVLHHL